MEGLTSLQLLLSRKRKEKAGPGPMMLRQVSYNGTTWTNTYDVNGLRTKREGGGKTYSYTYNGSLLSRMTVGDDTLTFFYDASGNPLSLIHNGTTYYYATNLQGDVVAILNASGTAVVTYTYDAWGKLLTTDGTMASTLGALNPLRYRGYVYDTETGLYYLQSRYYDPEVGRFINADAYATTGIGLVGNNAFAYCNNNPVNLKDYRGYLPGVAHTVTPYISQHDDGAGGNIRSGPRSDLANKPDLDINTAPPESYNCYGNAIGKQTAANPSGYSPGDSTSKTYEAVKRDLGSNNVRDLMSIDDPIAPDEYKVAMRCGPSSYHFIRLTQDGWYNKSGAQYDGVYVDKCYVSSEIWYPMWSVNGVVYIGYPENDYPYYDDTIIYFAVKVGWDKG